MSQKQDSGRVGGLTPTSPTSYVYGLPLQVAALFAKDHPAERAVVLPLRFELSGSRKDGDGTSVEVDHSTINRWVLKYAPELDRRIRSHLEPTNNSWRVDETYVSSTRHESLVEFK